MINPNDHPVAWALLASQIDDAAEGIAALLRDLDEMEDFGEPELRVHLAHIYSHLNQAWNTRNQTEESDWGNTHFPTDLTPLGAGG
ncbi:MAG: hypothetical protein AAFQ43_01495 [Bacteroidota bacterium]